MRGFELFFVDRFEHRQHEKEMFCFVGDFVWIVSSDDAFRLSVDTINDCLYLHRKLCNGENVILVFCFSFNKATTLLMILRRIIRSNPAAVIITMKVSSEKCRCIPFLRKAAFLDHPLFTMLFAYLLSFSYSVKRKFVLTFVIVVS